MGEAVLPLPYIRLLKHLLAAGGVGRVDQVRGHIEAGPTRDIVPGDAISWLYLASWGCVEAVMDRPGWVEISPLGKHFAEGGK